MRVTNQMMAANTLANLNQLRSYTASLTNQITSGERITRVSEDPVAGGDVMRIQSRMNVMKQWESSLSNTKSWVRATEAKLGDITDLLNKAKELALTAANGTTSDETRKSLAPVAEQLLKDLMTALNEREPNGYLFGGFKTEPQTDPLTGATIEAFTLDDVTGAVTYNGDQGIMRRDVGPGVSLDANIPGSRLVDQADPDNMVGLLWELKTVLKTAATEATNDANADGIPDADLNGDLYIDVDADSDSIIDSPTANSMLMPQSPAALMDRIRAVAVKLDPVRQGVIALRSEMGARDSRIEHLESKLMDTRVVLDDALQQAQGVDMTKAIMDLNNADTTYRAALQVGARIIPPTLADFLR